MPHLRYNILDMCVEMKLKAGGAMEYNEKDYEFMLKVKEEYEASGEKGLSPENQNVKQTICKTYILILGSCNISFAFFAYRERKKCVSMRNYLSIQKIKSQGSKDSVRGAALCQKKRFTQF